jgi:hypothetical protein
MNFHIVLRRLLPVLFLTLTTAFFFPACKSPQVAPGTPNDGSLASVFVTNSTRVAISDVTFNVFRENGFMLRTSSHGEMVFERDGTKWDTLAYGGWFESIFIRARVAIAAYELGVFRISCKVYRVDTRGDLAMGEEKPISRKSAEYYQGMLSQVRTRIDAAARIPPVPPI